MLGSGSRGVVANEDLLALFKHGEVAIFLVIHERSDQIWFAPSDLRGFASKSLGFFVVEFNNLSLL